MYKDAPIPARILIIKTSSLGDIVQTLNVLDDLRSRFPSVAIDWAVEACFQPIVAAHPLVRRAIPLDIKKRQNLWSSLKELRKEEYDIVFDLQANCKSAVITFLSRGRVKVGYGLKSVREWPNILATHVRFDISRQKNIRAFYLELIEKYFKKPTPKESEGVCFNISEEEKGKVSTILAAAPSNYQVMVCPGAKWANKQVKLEVWVEFLQLIEEEYQASFLFMWGDENEKVLCRQLAASLKLAVVVDKLPIPTWQNLMSEMDLVLAVDSSALHLCGTTSTPSFSIFGPTSPDVFKPIGERHCAIQGACPYGRTFQKQCPVLRSCPTGACIKNLTAQELFAAFQNRRESLRL